MTRLEDLLTSPYRAVRPIVAPGDGPWAGMLTSLPSGERGVLVDAEVLGAGWGGWNAVPEGHVLGPLDVVRIPGGHEIILPVCPETLEGFIMRRQASAAPLTGGEAVTIGVSLLRGSVDLLGRDAVAGQWWLTDAGRPVFATDAAPSLFRDDTLAVLGALARAVPHPSAWAGAADAVSAPRPSAAELDRAEVELFTIADPVALDLTTSALRSGILPAVRNDPVGSQEREPRRALWESLARHIDADLADVVSRATTSVWRRARGARRERRRAPLLVGAGIAAAVLCVGLMWPEGEGSVATAEGAGSAGTTPVAQPTVASTASGTEVVPGPGSQSDSVGAAPDSGTGSGSGSDPSAGSGTDEDLEAGTSALLERLDRCGDDGDCIAELAMDGSAGRLQPAAAPAERRKLVLLDDFGGMAVLRVDDSAEKVPAQLVVIALEDGEWLLRDIQDAAQQP
ncbi:hypothetical protein [Microbacterium sp. SSM24]|uniref:hypothetical protein n=1 Tax=Microbacterium sp. SSM24 TaxID=2991714 RepID=UPI0022278454|nr:hypothetical protein [Microbacterium sp. SSM24]MCW3494587.1 hypothetical protein [Microbacterium sp. SSM24]